MLFFSNCKYDEKIRNRILAAFPESLHDDVDTVINVIKKELFAGDRRDYNLQTQVYVFTLLSDETVAVPYRLWIDDRSNAYELSPIQQSILHCIYSRSTDGYVREKHIRALLENDVPAWAYPFVLKLCDEYIAGILEAVYDNLKNRDNTELKAFCQKNTSYFVYSHARMISYWDCFYRDRYDRYRDYIGRKLYHKCLGYSRRLEKEDRSGYGSYYTDYSRAFVPRDR